MGIIDKLKDVAGDFGVAIPGVNKQEQNLMQPTQPAQNTDQGLYNPQIEKLIDMALADGELTEKEKQVLFKKAESMGIDLDEFEMVLDARLYNRTQQSVNQGTGVSSQPSAPQSSKFGDVKKCPSCGAMIQSFTTKCPECGFEFHNVEANGNINKLFEMLNAVENNSREDTTTLIGSVGRFYGDALSKAFGGNKDTRKKKAIIQNYPIPNTKEDILEFLSLAYPLAKRQSLFSSNRQESEEMRPTWKAKCEQVIIKAKFSMKDDKETLDQIMDYAKKLGIKA